MTATRYGSETDYVCRRTVSVDRLDRQVAGARRTRQLDISCIDEHDDHSDYEQRTLSTNKQGNHAIAKMTARCAQYVGTLKIVGLGKRKIRRRLRKNLHITIRR